MKPQFTISVCLLGIVLGGCGGAQTTVELSPRELLSRGEWAHAREAALKRGGTTSEDRAIVALATLAETPTYASARKAVAALTNQTNGIGAAVAADEMLFLTFELPDPPDVSFSLLIVEIALGATGQGPFAPAPPLQIQVGTATRNVAANSLERMQLSLMSTSAQIDPKRLQIIWNACFTLLGGAIETANEDLAWKLFQSIGRLALIMNRIAPNDDLSQVLLRSAIAVVENNPHIAMAARCDFASPFDEIRAVIAHKRDLARRFEQAVAAATGCKRGAYAPQPKR